MTATDTDTTTEPDTESAGTKSMLLKSVVFISIFCFLFFVISNQTIKKNSHWLITTERSN